MTGLYKLAVSPSPKEAILKHYNVHFYAVLAGVDGSCLPGRYKLLSMFTNPSRYWHEITVNSSRIDENIIHLAYSWMS